MPRVCLGLEPLSKIDCGQVYGAEKAGGSIPRLRPNRLGRAGHCSTARTVWRVIQDEQDLHGRPFSIYRGCFS